MLHADIIPAAQQLLSDSRSMSLESLQMMQTMLLICKVIRGSDNLPYSNHQSTAAVAIWAHSYLVSVQIRTYLAHTGWLLHLPPVEDGACHGLPYSQP